VPYVGCFVLKSSRNNVEKRAEIGGSTMASFTQKTDVLFVRLNSDWLASKSSYCTVNFGGWISHLLCSKMFVHKWLHKNCPNLFLCTARSTLAKSLYHLRKIPNLKHRRLFCVRHWSKGFTDGSLFEAPTFVTVFDKQNRWKVGHRFSLKKDKWEEVSQRDDFCASWFSESAPYYIIDLTHNWTMGLL